VGAIRRLVREPRRGDAGVNWLQRVRRYWLSEPVPDHPLSEEERRSVPPTAIDEAAKTAGDFFGERFEPDTDDRPWQ
jgi:hypothetical protein